jgi:FMN phosphatase YigB (HAD superfamily)
MTPDRFADLAGRADLISTDVFDTLLLRRSTSERSRIVQGERFFSSLLASRGWLIDADLLVSTRMEAQRLAFRALAVREAGEVQLAEIIARQLYVLGLPDSLIDERLSIELQVEKASLLANKLLADLLRARRKAGARIIAVSDTTLRAQSLSELIRHFHGPDLIDRIYSSADYARTKRDGDLFVAIAEAERIPFAKILHIGDDLKADVRTPAALGIAVLHVPRSRSHRYGRIANAVFTEAGRIAAFRARIAKATAPKADSAFAFGKFVLGPIVTQFCVAIWLYAAQAETIDRATLLFCARGGIGIREVFERVLAKLGLPLCMARENFMISRLIAARAALLAQSASALQELGREFRSVSFEYVARALGGRPYELPPEWQRPFSAGGFPMLLFGRTGGQVLADIQQQHALFVRHFSKLRGNATRIVLCDTGLYGSTQRLLATAFPELKIETIQFARSNYKGHGEEHFPKLAGLLVEQNYYSPFNVRSCVLRYWHLIESLFEPKIPSVRMFADDGRDEVTANCGDIGFGSIDPGLDNNLLSGALSYVNALPVHGGAVALRDAEVAWLYLKRAITRPNPAELQCLEIGSRSVDFGRNDMLRVSTATQPTPWPIRLASVRAQLWREGAIAREFPILKHAMLPILESAYSLRGVFARQH